MREKRERSSNIGNVETSASSVQFTHRRAQELIGIRVMAKRLREITSLTETELRDSLRKLSGMAIREFRDSLHSRARSCRISKDTFAREPQGNSRQRRSMSCAALRSLHSLELAVRSKTYNVITVQAYLQLKQVPEYLPQLDTSRKASRSFVRLSSAQD